MDEFKVTDEFKPVSEVQPTKVEEKKSNSPSAEANSSTLVFLYTAQEILKNQ